ncbi:MAG: ABC transporter permease [Bacteroidota bacterium]|nr:ABC transporter permease [Bacteroidota bacterium]
MIRNYLKVALRNILRQKFFAVINISGLAIGISCCLLILAYVSEEFSYDNFHPEKENIYRIALDRKFPDNSFVYARTPMPMGTTLATDVPTVTSFTRIYAAFNSLTFVDEDRQFDERNVMAVDSTFFDFFAVEFVAGDKNTALDMPNSLVVTEDMARKYFGDEPAVGKQLTIQNVGEVMVRGVVKPMPVNSHFHFDFLFSLSTIPGLYQNNFWGSYNTHTYIKLEPGTSVENIEASIRQIVKTYMEPQVQNILGISWAQYEEAGNDHRYFLQPLESIHLNSNLQWEIEPNGNKTVVHLFLAISIFILLIACINFINLTTARAANRAREVGMRKVLGALKNQLIGQFLVESIIMCLLATVLATGMASLLLPFFNQLAGKSFSIEGLLSTEVCLGLAAFSMALGILAGLYPAFVLSAFKPVVVLKGKASMGARNSWLRNTLVILQFGISIILVIGTLIIYQQINYMVNKPLGFDRDQLVIVERAGMMGQEIETFKNILLDNPNISSAAGVNTFPGRQVNGGTFMDVQGSASDRYLIPNLRGDYDLIETMGLEVIDGRAFDRNIVTDTTAIIINEAAVRTFGWSDPIGKQLQPINGPIYNVIGVVKDFHFESLHQNIGPLALMASDLRNGAGLMVLKMANENVASTMATIEQAWSNFVPQRPLQLTFVDQEFGALYEAERRSGRLFSSFAVLAIVIACLGAFGLAAFLATQRRKEIGIRKVLGASVSSIVRLLSMEFVKLILLANLLAWPLAYYLMQQWLSSFAYAVGVNLWYFGIATIVSILIALLTISFHSIRAALMNPSHTLHTE